MTCASAVSTATFVPGTDEIDAAGIDDDQFCTLAQPLLQARTEYRVTVGRIGADHQHHVGLLDGVEVLRPCRRPEGLAEAVAGRGVADAGTGIDVIVAESGTDKLLDEKGFLVRATRRRDPTNGITAILILQSLELRGHMGEGFLPGDFPPGIRRLLADHRVEDTVLVVGIAIGEAALDAGMTAVRLPILPGHHAHQFLATHLRLEGATDTAIGAGGYDGMLRLADGDHRLLGERRGGACLDTCAAGDALRFEEVLMHAGRHATVEPAAFYGQREGALHLLAGPHAARAHDALRGIIGEVRVRLVLRHPLGVDLAVIAGAHMIGAVIAVAHVPETDGTRHVLQFTIAIGGAG